MIDLYLDNSKITDKGLKQIGTLISLTTLSLSDTIVTDEGIKELRTLKSLTYLVLYNTDVTAEGIKELRPLKSLTTLYFGKGNRKFPIICFKNEFKHFDYL